MALTTRSSRTMVANPEGNSTSTTAISGRPHYGLESEDWLAYIEDRFGALDQLVFCITLCQVPKAQSASRIYTVDRNVESFDFGPCTACVGKVAEQTYRDFVFHPF